MPYTPLVECVERHFATLADCSYDSFEIDHLDEIVRQASALVIHGGSLAEKGRAAIWFASAEYCRRGIAPVFREPLGHVAQRPVGPVSAMWRADAPYLDVQWLVYRWPDQALPPLSTPLRDMRYTSGDAEDGLSTHDRLLRLLGAFVPMHRYDATGGNVRFKCRALGMTRIQQVGMRYLATKWVKAQRKQINLARPGVRERLKSQATSIPQITDYVISRRLDYWRAWKLAGGATHWKDSAQIFEMITGVSVTLQGVKRVIEAMQQQKTIRKRSRRKLVASVIS